MIVTTGQTVILADGQFQTLCLFDDEAGNVFKDHLSYQPGADSVASLKARVLQRVAQQDRATKPPALPPAGVVLDLSTPAPVPPPKEVTDRAAALAAARAELQQRTFESLSPETRALFTDSAWIAGLTV